MDIIYAFTISELSSRVRLFSQRYFLYRGYSQGIFTISSAHIRIYTTMTGQ